MPDHLTLTVPVSGGRLNMTERQKLTVAGYLQPRDGKAVVLRLSKPTTPRSNNQNRFYWGVVLETIAAETGHTPEEVHAVLKEMMLPRKFITIGKHEHETAKSTTELTTDEFNLYLERVRAWANTELGIRLPLPNE